MYNFEFYLQEIADVISCPNDPTDISDFVAVKDYVLTIMRMSDCYFDDICENDILFGSTANNIRLYNDNEFDVLMELRFPDYSSIRQVADKQRPGFIFLDFSQAYMDDMLSFALANNQKHYLNRCRLKSWLHGVFKHALMTYGNVVDTGYEEYKLCYKWRGITYTIYAESETRRFAIDFVPAVKIVRPNSNTWHAIPKTKRGPMNTRSFTFLVSNTQEDAYFLALCGQVMRDALRLIQALCTSKHLHKLRYCHVVTVAIWMARRLGHSNVANMCVTGAFLTLLSDLCDAFLDGRLPYVWDVRLDLLDNFTTAELSQYSNDLCCAYNTLNSYQHQPALSYGRCLGHFQ